MDDVVFVEQTVAVDATTIDKGAVGAVFIGQAELPGDVPGDDGMHPAEAKVGNDQIVFFASSDPAGKPGDDEVKLRAVVADRFQGPLLFQCRAPRKVCLVDRG